ncbi:MAG: TOBE domain-containing protein [Rhodoferax sp.]
MKPSALQFAQAFGHEASDKRLDLLKRIGEVGSISEAARSAQVSYKAAWQALETLSQLAGAPLVEKAVGGSGGGGARLTAAGVQLLEAAELLGQARSQVLSALAQRAGNALNLPGLLGLGLRTSMRNQLACEIQAITTDAGSASVRLALPGGQTWVSRITRESAEILGLRVGLSVLALCKATAVQIRPQHDKADGLNLLSGSVTALSQPVKDGEATLQLAPGLPLIGFATSARGLRVGQPAVAAVQASAVVIAATA